MTAHVTCCKYTDCAVHGTALQERVCSMTRLHAHGGSWLTSSINEDSNCCREHACQRSISLLHPAPFSYDSYRSVYGSRSSNCITSISENIDEGPT